MTNSYPIYSLVIHCTLHALTSDFSLSKFWLISYGLTFHLHDKVVRLLLLKQKRRHYPGVTDVDSLEPSSRKTILKITIQSLDTKCNPDRRSLTIYRFQIDPMIHSGQDLFHDVQPHTG